ncbi:8199_t:CDS:2, partial [Diversispora eburnea]
VMKGKDFISEKEFQERKTRRDLLVKIVILKVRGSDTISNLKHDGNYLDSEILDPRHHHDFTNSNDGGKIYMRGGG